MGQSSPRQEPRSKVFSSAPTWNGYTVLAPKSTDRAWSVAWDSRDSGRLS